jgi:hypothetical protein
MSESRRSTLARLAGAIFGIGTAIGSSQKSAHAGGTGLVQLDTSNAVSVTEFGAQGVGGDDTAAFAAALATGRRVVVPKPAVAYGISGNLNVTGILEGEGWNSASLKAISPSARITVNSLAEVRNLRFDGNNLATLAIVTQPGANRVLMERVRVDNVIGVCFQLVNTQNSILRECEANHFTGIGFRISGAENCGLDNCNSNQNTPSNPTSRGILAEAYKQVAVRNFKIASGIFERGSSDFQIEFRSAMGFISIVNAEINVGVKAAIKWSARTDTSPPSGGQLRVVDCAFTMDGRQVAVDGMSSNLEYFVHGSVMNGTSGRAPLSLLLGKAKTNESRARLLFESSFEADAENWNTVGRGSLVYNASNKTIDCRSFGGNSGVLVASPSTFATQFPMNGRWIVLDILVTALSGAPALSVGTTTRTGGRFGLASLTLGLNRIAVNLEPGDTGILIGASTPVETTFSLRWVKAQVL